jgi:chorismate dehydratase
MSVRIGSVPYLNEKPLTRWFKHTDEGRGSGIEVVYAVPSTLASMLASGEIAAALVSSFEYLRTPGYRIVPRVSISGQDEILSVRAFARLPWRQVQSVALDMSSLTSTALLKILLADHYNAYPDFINQPPDLDAMLAVADAALLIGDPGMLANADGLFTLDLGDAWRRLTGLPFVYACWIGDEKALTPLLIESLQTAKEWGLTQVDAIAEEEAARLQCPVALCRRYLTEVMDYDLGEEELAGLDEFASRAFHHQLIPTSRTLEIASRR